MKKIEFRSLIIFGLIYLLMAVGFGFSPVQQEEDQNLSVSNISDVFWTSDSKNVIQIGDSLLKRYPVPDLNPQVHFYTLEEKQIVSGFCSETNAIAILEDRQKVIFYDASNAQILKDVPLPFMIQNGSCSPDGKTYMLSSADEISVELINPKTGEQIKNLSGFNTAAPVYNVIFSPDGSKILWHSRASFQLQNIGDEQFSEIISLWDFVDVYSLSPDSKILATAILSEDTTQNLVIFWDTQTGKELGRIELIDQSARSIAFDPGGKFVIIADESNLNWINLPDYKITWTEPFLSKESNEQEIPESIRKAVFAPDGQFLAVMTNKGQISLVRFKNE